MAWSFGDSFDLYAAPGDAVTGYWDSGGTGFNLNNVGRFGARCLTTTTITNTAALVKSSGVNDAVHHVVVAVWANAAITGTNILDGFTLSDGTTAQCSIGFRSDGAILLISGALNSGTTLATYAGAVTVINTWYGFEFEVVIHNTTGSFTVRKNGNNVADFTATSLDTQTSANAYANKLTVATGPNAASGTYQFDDLFWKSDASVVAWMGDLRCYTRMPATDQSVQFSRAPTNFVQTPLAQSGVLAVVAGRGQYTPFVAAVDGAIGSATVSFGTGYTGNLKCSIFASSGSAPTTVLGSANIVVNPATGSNPITFGTPITVSKGTQYWIGFDSDTASGTWTTAATLAGVISTTAYASFPVASPTLTTGLAPIFCSLTIAVSTNNSCVNEAQQDGLTSYVYDSNPGDADFYAIGSIPAPASTVAVITRGYMQKSDAGTRTAAIQVKSGATTVATPTLTLTNSGWQWASRTDLLDPNTGAAWAAAAVDALQVGPKVVA